MDAWGWIAAAGTTLMVDRLAKLAALRLFASGCGVRLVENERPFLSPRASGATLVGLWVVAAGCAVAALAAVPASGPRGLIGIGLAVALGGAASNVIDRLKRRAIIDFIAVPWWPVFNLADVAIVLGAALAVVAFI